MNLSEKETSTVVLALRVAAAVYREDAERASFAGNQTRLAEQFIRQQADALSLANKLEEQ